MISAVSGGIAVFLGLVIMLYPKDVALSVWQVAGIMLILEAIIDLVSIIQIFRVKKESQAQPWRGTGQRFAIEIICVK